MAHKNAGFFKITQQIDLNKSLIISILAHLIILLILGISIKDFPFSNQFEPVLVSIESAEYSMAAGLNEAMSEPSQQSAPEMTQRISDSTSTPSAPEVINPSVQDLAPVTSQSDIQEAIQDVPTVQNSSDLQEETATTPDIEPWEQDLDEYFEETFEEDIARQQLNDELAEIDQSIDDILNQNIDNALNEDTSSGPASSDELSDAEWSAAPRATLYFPSINDKIPAEYRQMGIGYSLKVKITFDKNGLATGVDIITSSGDPTIDNIFAVELRKIRVEAIDFDRTDTVTKTFTISME